MGFGAVICCEKKLKFCRVGFVAIERGCRCVHILACVPSSVYVVLGTLVRSYWLYI